MTLRLVAFLLTGAVASSGCGDVLEPPAAVVAGEKIMIEEITAAVERLSKTDEFERLAETQDEDILIRQLEQTHLAQVVRRAVLEPKADQLGVVVTEEDVEKRIEDIRSRFPDEDAFEEAVAEQGLTLELLEELVRDRLLEEELRAKVAAEVAAGEEELRAYYESHRADYAETEVSHIVVASREEAQEIYDKLVAAPERRFKELFRRLAKRHSEDRQSGPRGGNLGYFSPGQFVEPFEDAAAALEAGELSRPVETEFGWHVIWVTDRRMQSFEQVRDEIEAEVSGTAEDEAWERWIVAAYEEAEVRVNPRYGRLDPVTGQIVDPPLGSLPGVEESAPPSPLEPGRG